MTVMPYLMPRMHDRYFLPAQLCLVTLTCCDTRFLLPSALLETALLLTFGNYLRTSPQGVGFGEAISTAIVASTLCVFLLVREMLKSRALDRQERNVTA